MDIFIYGSGAWGTALALLLDQNGHSVTLWSHSPEKAAAMARVRKNPSLAGIALSASLQITADPAGVNAADMAVFASPSYVLRQTAVLAREHIRPGTVLISATKGIEQGTNLRMSEVLHQVIGNHCPIAVLSGPSHAEEVSRRMGTGCVAACGDRAVAELVQRTFMNDTFRVYSNQDVVGVELCGAAKNIVAIGCGIIDGLALGANAKALYMTRAMAEIARLCQLAGGQRATCSGLAGMGDLIVTCTSDHSRNLRAGKLIGCGAPVAQAIREVGAVVEGYYAAASVTALGHTLGAELPICQSLYDVLYQDADPETSLRNLMKRNGRSEFDFNWNSTP